MLEVLPDHCIYDSKGFTFKDHVNSTPVATCDRCRLRRQPLPRGLVFCPGCGHALFWERINKASPRHIRKRSGQ